MKNNKTQIKILLRERLLLERDFNGLSGNQLTDNEINSLYQIFKNSYLKSIGTSWNFDKFKSRITNWTLFGNSEGFVTARKENNGNLKLTGSGGNLKGVLSGLNQLLSTNKPIWGIVTIDIANMLKKRDFFTPNKYFVDIILKILSDQLDGKIQVNNDGSFIITDEFGNSLNKVFVANKLYYKSLLVNNEIMAKLPTIVKLWIKSL